MTESVGDPGPTAAPVSADEAPRALAPAGQVLGGRYALAEELGRGGFSIVYAARDLHLGQPVAVKLLVPPPAHAQLALERLRREVRAVRTLSHPNIVTIFDLIESQERAFIVMARVHGGDLATRVAARGPLSPEATAELGGQIAAALGAAHRAFILHRDVKPQNILMQDDGRAFLVDFGSARIEGEATLTGTGALVGTLDYTAPEVLAGDRADARADVYALGLSLFFALTGRLPDRPSPHLPPPPAEDGHSPRAIAAAVPPWLDETVRRATVRDPRRRFHTADLLGQALAQGGKVTGLSPSRWRNTRFCLGCGATQPAGGTLCRACRVLGPAAADGLLLLAPVPGGSARARRQLAELIGEPAAAKTISDVVGGRRALARVRLAAERALRDQFQRRGMEITIVPASAPERAIPKSFLVLMGLMILVTLPISERHPLHAVGGFLLALALYVAARRAMSAPLLDAARDAERVLSPDLEARVESALTTVGQGGAEALLTDIVEIGKRSIAAARQRATGHEVAGRLEALIASSVDAAQALARVDSNLAALERRLAQPDARGNARLEEALDQGTQARNALIQRLLESLAAASEAESDATTAAEGALARLDAASAELREEIAIRRQALAEVEAL